MAYCQSLFGRGAKGQGLEKGSQMTSKASRHPGSLFGGGRKGCATCFLVDVEILPAARKDLLQVNTSSVSTLAQHHHPMCMPVPALGRVPRTGEDLGFLPLPLPLFSTQISPSAKGISSIQPSSLASPLP